MEVPAAVRTVIGLLDPATAWTHLFKLQGVAFASQSQFEHHLRHNITFDEYIAQLAKLDAEERQRLVKRAERDAKVKLVAGSWRQRSLQANADIAQVKALVDALHLLKTPSTFDQLWTILQDELKGSSERPQPSSGATSRRATLDSISYDLVASPASVEHTPQKQDSKAVARDRKASRSAKAKKSKAEPDTPAESNSPAPPAVKSSVKKKKVKDSAASKPADRLRVDAPPTPARSNSTGSPVPSEVVGREKDVQAKISASNAAQQSQQIAKPKTKLAPTGSGPSSSAGASEKSPADPEEKVAAKSSNHNKAAERRNRRRKRRSTLVGDGESIDQQPTPQTADVDDTKTKAADCGLTQSGVNELSPSKTSANDVNGSSPAQPPANAAKTADSKANLISNADIGTTASTSSKTHDSRKRKRKSDVNTAAPKNKVLRTASPVPIEVENVGNVPHKVGTTSTQESTDDAQGDMVDKEAVAVSPTTASSSEADVVMEESLPENKVAQAPPTANIDVMDVPQTGSTGRVAKEGENDVQTQVKVDDHVEKVPTQVAELDDSSVVSTDSSSDSESDSDENGAPFPPSAANNPEAVQPLQPVAIVTRASPGPAPKPSKPAELKKPSAPTRSSPKPIPNHKPAPKSVTVKPSTTNTVPNNVPRAQGPQATMDALRKLEKFSKYGDENYPTSEEEDSESSSSDESSEDVGPSAPSTSAPRLSTSHSDDPNGAAPIGSPDETAVKGQHGDSETYPGEQVEIDISKPESRSQEFVDSGEDQHTVTADSPVNINAADNHTSSDSASEFAPDSDSGAESEVDNRDAEATSTHTKASNPNTQGVDIGQPDPETNDQDQDPASDPTTTAGGSSQKRKRRTFEKVSKYFDITPERSPLKKPRVPAGTSAVPFPSTDAPRFGVMQEKFADNPYRLLLATTVCNKTAGRFAIPTLNRLLEEYPTPQDLASADTDKISSIVQHLGFQNQRARKLIQIAQNWIDSPPQKGTRYRTFHYPRHGDGAKIKPSEVLTEDAQDCAGALEIGHISGCGPYAYDSWRIFCRDTLRGVTSDDGAEPEWKRVVPTDKELRAYLRWMWLREGYVWDPLTGTKVAATAQQLADAKAGVLEVPVQSHVTLDEPTTVASAASDKFEEPIEALRASAHDGSSAPATRSPSLESTPPRTIRPENTRQRSVRRKASHTVESPSKLATIPQNQVEVESPSTHKRDPASSDTASLDKHHEVSTVSDGEESVAHDEINDVAMNHAAEPLNDAHSDEDEQIVTNDGAPERATRPFSPVARYHRTPNLGRRTSQIARDEIPESDTESAQDDSVVRSVEPIESVHETRKGVTTAVPARSAEAETNSGSEYWTSNEEGYTSSAEFDVAGPRQASEELI